jgi:hypothetical protein
MNNEFMSYELEVMVVEQEDRGVEGDAKLT